MSRPDSAMKGKLVFLVGARRSGTNWVERILAAHPDIVAMPSETYLFSHGIEPLMSRFQHANPGFPALSRTFVEREGFLDALRDFLDHVFLDNLRRLGPDARYLVERTPGHASHLGVISSIYPDAHVLHAIRDGRAVARSLLSMDWGPTTVREAASDWRRAVADARAGGRAFGPRYHEIYYERLMDQQSSTIDELFGWLGLELDEDMRERIFSEASSAFNVDPGAPELGTDKWRGQLSESDVRTFERVAGDQLRACGYPLATTGPGAGARRPTSRLLSARRRFMLRHWRPQSATRAAVNRAYARHYLRARNDKRHVVVAFERNVAEGKLDDALAMLRPGVRVRIVDETSSFQGRGGVAAHKLLSALAAHQEMGLRPLLGGVDSSEEEFTTVVRYELADGSSWIRTLVFDVKHPWITAVAMYRFPLASRNGSANGSVAALERNVR